jgi:hypothetical protein
VKLANSVNRAKYKLLFTFFPPASAWILNLSPYLKIPSPPSDAATILNTFLREGAILLDVVTA